MTHRGPFQPLLFCDSVIQPALLSQGLRMLSQGQRFPRGTRTSPRRPAPGQVSSLPTAAAHPTPRWKRRAHRRERDDGGHISAWRPSQGTSTQRRQWSPVTLPRWQKEMARLGNWGDPHAPSHRRA